MYLHRYIIPLYLYSVLRLKVTRCQHTETCQLFSFFSFFSQRGILELSSLDIGIQLYMQVFLHLIASRTFYLFSQRGILGIYLRHRLAKSRASGWVSNNQPPAVTVSA
uniref:Uncharacterized protein n=1 Tax=Cacopsylla melanoneura TaxID=428564 RepID=A0A8D8X757_9HEMI